MHSESLCINSDKKLHSNELCACNYPPHLIWKWRFYLFNLSLTTKRPITISGKKKQTTAGQLECNCSERHVHSYALCTDHWQITRKKVDRNQTNGQCKWELKLKAQKKIKNKKNDSHCVCVEVEQVLTRQWSLITRVFII